MRVLTSTLALITILFAANGALGGDVPEAVTKAHAAVQKNADAILKFAYPTAKEMTDATSATYHERLGGGFTLDEKFNYADSDGDRQSFTLRFKVDDNGVVTSISEQQRSEIWPTFGTGNLLLAAVKSSAQDKIDEARRNDQPPPQAALLILKADDITDVLVIILNRD